MRIGGQGVRARADSAGSGLRAGTIGAAPSSLQGQQHYLPRLKTCGVKGEGPLRKGYARGRAVGHPWSSVPSSPGVHPTRATAIPCSRRAWQPRLKTHDRTRPERGGAHGRLKHRLRRHVTPPATTATARRRSAAGYFRRRHRSCGSRTALSGRCIIEGLCGRIAEISHSIKRCFEEMCSARSEFIYKSL